MNISITTAPPASVQRPAVLINGKAYNPTAAAGPEGKPVSVHLRHALYSGSIPPAAWSLAERCLNLALRGPGGAIGGAIGGLASGKRKARGGKAHYAWLVACREAKRNGLPQPPKPPARGGKARAQ